jgi:hypothetical protein
MNLARLFVYFSATNLPPKILINIALTKRLRLYSRFIYLLVSRNIREVKTDVYGRPLTENFKSYLELECLLFEVSFEVTVLQFRVICVLKLKHT